MDPWGRHKKVGQQMKKIHQGEQKNFCVSNTIENI